MMKKVHATSAAPARTRGALIASYVTAALLVTVTLLQLFRFEYMPDVVREYELFGMGAESLIVAAILVTVQVAALPFLLRLPLSPLARVLSMIAGWIAVAAWLVIAVWVSHRDIFAVTDGFLELRIGWWYVWFWLGVAALTIWASWGQWPFVRSTTKKSPGTKSQSAKRSS